MLKIVEIARNLRKDLTEAEVKFWNLVRNHKLNGKKFFRQYPIRFKIDGCNRFFVADFYCSENKLVIEIDGGIHECQKDYDELRTYIINMLGYKVIRFSNDDVLHNIEKVITDLKKQFSP